MKAKGFKSRKLINCKFPVKSSKKLVVSKGNCYI
jgi:hypothetical protein